jgi:hypothetical protein
MPSHSRFGHLHPKLWAKEGPGVKLAVWLPTTKSRESTRSRCPIRECDTPLERSRRGLQLPFRPRRDPRSGRGVMPSQSPGSPKPGHLGGFRDSNLGVPGICAIWMWVRRSVAGWTPCGEGGQQPLQSLEKLRKYKGGSKCHEMATSPSPKMWPWSHSALKALSISSCLS